jgi:hypothetical protein
MTALAALNKHGGPAASDYDRSCDLPPQIYLHTSHLGSSGSVIVGRTGCNAAAESEPEAGLST